MINNIINGWGNLIKDKFGLLDEQTKAMSTKRLMICNDCKMRSIGVCDPMKRTFNIKTGKLVTGCGCLITAKSMDFRSVCPAGKW